jgi:hypothetical protein
VPGSPSCESATRSSAIRRLCCTGEEEEDWLERMLCHCLAPQPLSGYPGPRRPASVQQVEAAAEVAIRYSQCRAWCERETCTEVHALPTFCSRASEWTQVKSRARREAPLTVPASLSQRPGPAARPHWAERRRSLLQVPQLPLPRCRSESLKLLQLCTAACTGGFGALPKSVVRLGRRLSLDHIPNSRTLFSCYSSCLF